MENKRSFELREDIDNRLREKTIKTLFVFFIILLFITLGFIWLKYEIEGTKGLTFEIKEILIISTADGKRIENKNKNIKTDKLEVSQVNDFFITIEEKDNINLDNSIKKISIANFDIQEEPKKGNLNALEPTGPLSQLFVNSKKNYLDKEIEFKGAKVDDLEQLETSSKGGTVAFRIENKLGSYDVKKEEVLEYNSKLLNKFVKNVEDIQFKLSFDLIIELDNGFKYSTKINVNKPSKEILKEDKLIHNMDVEEISFKKI